MVTDRVNGPTKTLLIAGLALLLTACVPIPAEEPPTRDPTPQMQANVDDFAAVFARMEGAISAIPAEEYKAAILELRDCLMTQSGPHEMPGLTDGEIAAIQWHIIYMLLLNYQFEEEGMVIDHLRKGLADCQKGAW